jgi:hypothetical protein
MISEPPPPAPAGRPRALFWTLLVTALAASAFFRLSGLSWGLRHPVHRDEQDFVTRVVEMVQAGDLDHRWYQYPGLFLYMLGAGVAALGPERAAGPDAYWISRVIVASFGVLNTGLLYAVGTRLVGVWGGFAAALFLALSPIEVDAFHQVRADVVVQTLGILTIPAFRRLGPDLRGDRRMGALIGLATAVKFTGLLLVPSYLFARFLAGARWFRGYVIAGALTIAITLACTPYALIHFDRYFSRTEYNGVLGGPSTYYQGPSHFREHVAFFLSNQHRSWGLLASLLFLAGLYLCLRESWRAWSPPLVHLVTTIAAMSAATMIFPRHMAPAMGVVYLMAAAPLQRVFRWNRLAAVLLTGAALVPSARASYDAVKWFAGPSAADKALDWIQANVPPGARILETRPGTTIGGHPGAMIGIDPRRHELLFLRTDLDRVGPRLSLLAPHMDVVVTEPGDRQWMRGLKTVYAAAGPHGNVVIELRRPIEEPARTFTLSDLASARLKASENPAGLERLRDGDAATTWSTAGPMAGTEWLEITFDEARSVSSLELVLGAAPSRHAPELLVSTSVDGKTYEVVRAEEARPPVGEQQAASRRMSQEVVLDARPVRGVRIAQLGRRPEPWAVAELIVHEKRPPS